jgi:hypothetical protein
VVFGNGAPGLTLPRLKEGTGERGCHDIEGQDRYRMQRVTGRKDETRNSILSANSKRAGTVRQVRGSE